MQTAESVCLWNYQFKNKTSYLTCTKNLLCQNELLSKAIIYCIQCNSLQCFLCDNEIHKNLNNNQHQRLNLDEIENEFCSIDQQHQAIFYCSTCSLSFCYNCYEKQHQQSDEREHKLQKYRDEQSLSIKNNNDQHKIETKPIKIPTSSNVNNDNTEPSAYSFEDVQIDNNDENNLSLLNRKEHSIQSVTYQMNKSNSMPKQHNFNQQMLLESMIDDNENDHTIKSDNCLSQQNQSDSDSQKEFLLFDTNEHLTINNESEFLHRLKCEKDLSVKCISIIGNTGDGKSYTLNQVFFNGQEIFHTSSTANSSTLGIWTALDENHQILIFDTEGHFGLSENDNKHNRLLLKILCISDIIIYRTRASKLSNDMFQFLSDISNVFIKYFRKELENIMKNCKIDEAISTIGPTLIIFHETQHTEILKDYFQCQKTAVEQLKERFETMKLSYDAYSSIEYVGIQTQGEESSDFNKIKETITVTLDNNRRVRRPLSVIFKVLKALNEKFNHVISPSIPSTLPDDFFACNTKCLSCGAKCIIPANHEKDNIPHKCDKRCLYNKELDNEVWKCLLCHRDGRDTIVYGKLIKKNDNLVQGLLKYVWSGCAIECRYHGEIYRSRKHWFGNHEPKDVTYVEIIHIWPDDDNSRLASDVTPRKFVELIVYASSYLSAPTKLITEMVADQVAPSYWVPNKYVTACSGCKLHFGSEYSKHHCRICGHVFCDTCTKYRRIVSWIDTEKSVRVCRNCNENPKSLSEIQKQLSQKIYENGCSDDSISTTSSSEQLNDLYLTPTDIFDIEQPSTGAVLVDIPTSRRVYETVKSGLEKIGVNYPIELIKESTRPSYWKPDNECYACHICKRIFNNTTNRLHHCRSCGDGVCENCSPNQRPVPERDWLTPVRMFMYNGYSSYDSEIQRHIVCNSPLSSNVPLSVAEEIVLPYLKHINELIISNRLFSIITDKDFKWTLEIFAFGFTCEEPVILQLCSNIYVEWLKVFEGGTSNNSNSIPPILREKTEFYWSQMFWHLYHLFVVHDEKPADLLTKRIYTHKVLRQLQAMISQTDLSLDLWHILLQVFLAIGNTVLSSPYRTNEEATAVMSFRLVPSIYQVFLVAVCKVDIPPGLWRTFRDYAVTWCHRPAVVYDWAQLTCVLTSTVVRKLWWPDLVPLQYICTETDQSDYIQKIIDSLPLDLLVITWIKFLTILQNPSECGDVSIFLRMPKYANQLQGNSNIKLRDLTSLQELPRIFVNVTKAIGMFVDIWLGKDIDSTSLYSPKPMSNSTVSMNDNPTSNSNVLSSSRPFAQSVRAIPSNSQQQQQPPIAATLKPTKSYTENRRISTPPSQISSAVSPTTNTNLSLSISQQNRSEQLSKILRINRPTINSLMHLYGPWILDACLLQMKDRYTRSGTIINSNDSSRINEIDKTLDIQNERLIDEAFAKSFATICTIFSSAHCDEFIHAEYLSRFYYVLQQGLRFYQGDEQRSRTIIESILLNSADLFRINLRGINILLPLYLDAIECYLQIDFQTYINNQSNIKNVIIIRDRFIRIRLKSIQILMSIVSLPFYYEDLQQYLFEDYLEKSHDVQPTVKTFLQYRFKIFQLLLNALHIEQDITNVQLLFGTIRLACSLLAHDERQQGKSEEKVNKDIPPEYSSHAVLLICEKGTSDSQLFLAALDTLTSFVTDPICQIPIEIWKKVLKRLCTFIDTQLHLSPKHHTREMHSTCVATYNTLITLIIERPTLLDDVENLFQLCEIIELGISGEKAQSSEKIIYKKYKEFHPASQRVAEAAEYLMCILFEHKSLSQLTNVSQRSVEGACRHAELAGDILNEEAVLHLKNDICRNWLDETTFSNSMTSTQFKYFAVNGNTLFAITELPISVNNGMPAIILLCRGLFGKNVWTLNFRYNPLSNLLIRRNQSSERILSENDKTTSSSTISSVNDHKEKLVLPHSTRNERAKSDSSRHSSFYHPPELSIPTLNSVVKRDEEKLNLFRTLKTKQIKIEENAIQRTYLIDEKPIPECKPQECQKHFESIRLFLSHYGFCSLDSMHHLINGKQWNESKIINRLQPSIQLLDSNISTFMDDIKKLDKISPILYCTGQIFYLKRNQYTINESFLNMETPEQLNPCFLTMVSQFGSVVEIKRHCGWTGNIETSWKTVSIAQLNKCPTSKILAEIDGEDSILYWVDLTTEIAFYLPHHFFIDNESSEMRILIVWLEEFRGDLDSILPVQEQQSKSRDISIIGIYPLKNRLFRILLNSNAQRMQSACASIPLIDGMVIPLDILPFFLRQAVNNLSRRKRLEDSQNSQTAYSVRKKRITKIIDKYQNRTNHNLDEFFQNIFVSSTTTLKPQPIVTQSKARSYSMVTVQS